MLSTLNKETRQPTDVKRRELGCIRLADVGSKRTPALCMYNILTTTIMAKLADYYICDLLYTEEGYVILDEDEVHPNTYEDNDEYIKEYWGEYPFIGKFPVMYRGKLVDALVFKDFEQYFGVFKDEGKCMKDYIVVKDYVCETDRKPEVVAQFDTREKAEEYSLQHEGLYWVYEMSNEW